jgi:hypothetical protein
VHDNTVPLPDFTRWPSFPFEGDMRVKPLAAPVKVEPPRSGEGGGECIACSTADDAYIWVNERWRVRAMDGPTGLPMVLILECRSHLDLGDLSNLLAAELGIMTVRLERAVRSLDGIARVHVNRWGDGAAHLQLWFLARPYGLLQLRGTFLSLWDDILPAVPERQWQENLALVAAWLAGFDGQAIAEPPHIQWQAPSTFPFFPNADRPTGADVPASGEPASGETASGETASGEAAGGEPAVGRDVPTGDAMAASGGVPAAGEIAAGGGTVSGGVTLTDDGVPADGVAAVNGGTPTDCPTSTTDVVAVSPSAASPPRAAENGDATHGRVANTGPAGVEPAAGVHGTVDAEQDNLDVSVETGADSERPGTSDKVPTTAPKPRVNPDHIASADGGAHVDQAVPARQPHA